MLWEKLMKGGTTSLCVRVILDGLFLRNSRHRESSGNCVEVSLFLFM